MKKLICASILVLLPVGGMAADAPPDWAYPVAPPGYQPPPDNGQPKHIQGSALAFTQKDVDDAFNPPDWFPNEHAPMPQLVAHGKAAQRIGEQAAVRRRRRRVDLQLRARRGERDGAGRVYAGAAGREISPELQLAGIDRHAAGERALRIEEQGAAAIQGETALVRAVAGLRAVLVGDDVGDRLRGSGGGRKGDVLAALQEDPLAKAAAALRAAAAAEAARGAAAGQRLVVA